MEFTAFPKIPRLMLDITITEKLDGTNASIFIGENGEFRTGSRTRWITPEDDNYGFSRWAHANKDELMKLGPGHHFGEWWGQGIQRGYGLEEKRFSLFNVNKWDNPAVTPACCRVVPVLYDGVFDLDIVGEIIGKLKYLGSLAVPEFMKPEGIMIYHQAAGQYFKMTLEKDESPKSGTN